jgi:hypothetical protein
MGEFWDTHDFTDFDTDAPDVEFEISCAVPIELDLLSLLEKQVRLRGVNVETTVESRKGERDERHETGGGKNANDYAERTENDGRRIGGETQKL